MRTVITPYYLAMLVNYITNYAVYLYTITRFVIKVEYLFEDVISIRQIQSFYYSAVIIALPRRFL